jgi:hypothetical protein
LVSSFGGAPSSGLPCADGKMGDWASALDRFNAAHMAVTAVAAVTKPTPLRERSLFIMGANDIIFASIWKS